jgi:hypothetical protein
MGHIHLVRLPKTQPWLGVIRALRSPSLDPKRVATVTTDSASERLERLRSDPNLAYCFWMLTRLTSAARRPDFGDAVAQLGLRVGSSESASSFISQVAARVRAEMDSRAGSGPFGEMASLALRRALTETVGTEGRSLFGSSVEDLEYAFARHATPKEFGRLAQRFFGDLMARMLRFYVDKELSLYIGHGWALATSTQAISFTSDLERYARESARIVEAFAADWFSLHDWQADGVVSRDEVRGFVAEAMAKLRDELTEPPP